MLLPGIVEILADSELVFLAISSDKFIIFETLTPGAGSNSFNVTTGPLFIFFILPSTPKSNKIFSNTSPSIFCSEIIDLSFFVGSFKKFKDGKTNFFSAFFDDLIFCENGKSS